MDKEKVIEIMDYLYSAYGTGSGYLLGIEPARRESVRGIVIAILREYVVEKRED